VVHAPYYFGLQHATAPHSEPWKARACFEESAALGTSDAEAAFAREELAALGK
jgi:hypothetical protein